MAPMAAFGYLPGQFLNQAKTHTPPAWVSNLGCMWVKVGHSSYSLACDASAPPAQALPLRKKKDRNSLRNEDASVA